MISYAYLSKIGNRAANEDYVDVYEHDGLFLFALADGLGGHGGGDIASALVVSEVIDVFKLHAADFLSDFESADGCLPLCFSEAQESLLQEQKLRNRDMKSTLVLLNFNDDTARWGHVGDSRLYVFNDGKVLSRTIDHSVPQMLFLTGEISEEDIRFHPDRNRLLRAMGDEREAQQFEISQELALVAGMSFLLCTDGFWELIDEDGMLGKLKRAKSPDSWLAAMEKIVLKNGKGKKMDNYSAVAVWVR